jgi:hypothetical protein
VTVPDTVVVEPQFVRGITSDAYRKTAGVEGDARLFAGKNLELEH